MIGDCICEGVSFTTGASKVLCLVFNTEECGYSDESGYFQNAGRRRRLSQSFSPLPRIRADE